MRRIALALVVLLGACSSEGTARKVSEILEGINVVGRVSTIVLQSDTLIVGDVFSVEGDIVPSLTQYRCDGQSCRRDSQIGTPLIEPLLALANLSTDPRTDYMNPAQHQGVDLAQYSVTSNRNDVAWTFNNYGAWLTHSGFETSIGNATKAGGIELQAAYSLSFGNDTGTNPDGTATWTGVVIGNTRHGQIQPLRGDANIEFNLGTDPDLELDAVGSLDVRFVNIKNPNDTGYEHPDMPWPPVSVFADGTFIFQGNGRIAGSFYGADHAEVGGVFTHPTAFGAFGAKKQ